MGLAPSVPGLSMPLSMITRVFLIPCRTVYTSLKSPHDPEEHATPDSSSDSMRLVWPLLFLLATISRNRCLLFLSVLRCSVPHVPSTHPMCSGESDWTCLHRVSPSEFLGSQGRLSTPRGLSQIPTSFFGSWCQGIHRLPLKLGYKRSRSNFRENHRRPPPSPQKGNSDRSRFIFLEIASYKRCSRPLCSSQTTTPYHTPHTHNPKRPMRA